MDGVCAAIGRSRDGCISAATIQSAIAASTGGNYALAMAGTAAIVAIAIALLVGVGREARDAHMGTQVGAAAD